MFLHDELVVGDELEVRGPIGRWFVWDAGAPAVLVGGGSGVVPLMAMLRLARNLGRQGLPHLVVSVRTPGDLYYADELPERTWSSPGRHRRVRTAGRPPDAADLAPVATAGATAYVCGSSGFADAASYMLVDLGVAAQVRVERFGPSG